MAVPGELLAIMQCPRCGGGLEEETDPPALRCVVCGTRYPVDGDIPVMLAEEALPDEA